MLFNPEPCPTNYLCLNMVTPRSNWPHSGNSVRRSKRGPGSVTPRTNSDGSGIMASSS